MWVCMLMSFSFLVVKDKALSEMFKPFHSIFHSRQQHIHGHRQQMIYSNLISKWNINSHQTLANKQRIILLKQKATFMGNSIASTISTQLYPRIKTTVFPAIDANLQSSEAKRLKKHITQLFKQMQEAILPLSFEFNVKPGSAIGDYAEKINIFSFLVALRVRFVMWVDKGFPSYLKAKLIFETKVGMTDWSTVLSVLIEIRCSFF